MSIIFPEFDLKNHTFDVEVGICSDKNSFSQNGLMRQTFLLQIIAL